PPPPRQRPSFPTRRSSDLHVALAPLGPRLLLVGGGSNRVLSIDPRRGTVTTVARLPHAIADAAAVASGGHVYVLGGGTNAVYELDRKSTRLNSSHLGISYA